MANFDLLCFGIAAEIMGVRQTQRPADPELTAGKLQQQLLQEFPAFQSLASVKLAVNQAYAQENTPIGAGDEVAIIPPVSGG
jgi:molybdopterin converting factor subunit 1